MGDERNRASSLDAKLNRLAHREIRKSFQLSRVVDDDRPPQNPTASPSGISFEERVMPSVNGPVVRKVHVQGLDSQAPARPVTQSEERSIVGNDLPQAGGDRLQQVAQVEWRHHRIIYFEQQS